MQIFHLIAFQLRLFIQNNNNNKINYRMVLNNFNYSKYERSEFELSFREIVDMISS